MMRRSGPPLGLRAGGVEGARVEGAGPLLGGPPGKILQVGFGDAEAPQVARQPAR